MSFFLLLLAVFLRRGRLATAIEKAVAALEFNGEEKERLGAEMLDSLLNSNRRIDYLGNGVNGQKAPARLLVAANYFYQAESSLGVGFVRRSDVEAMGWEPPLKTLYTVLFYYHSSRGRRLKGDNAPDKSMRFFDKEIRDKAYFMMGGKVK